MKAFILKATFIKCIRNARTVGNEKHFPALYIGGRCFTNGELSFQRRFRLFRIIPKILAEAPNLHALTQLYRIVLNEKLVVHFFLLLYNCSCDLLGAYPNMEICLYSYNYIIPLYHQNVNYVNKTNVHHEIILLCLSYISKKHQYIFFHSFYTKFT